MNSVHMFLFDFKSNRIKLVSAFRNKIIYLHFIFRHFTVVVITHDKLLKPYKI